MAQYYDRYSRFRLNAEIEPIPGITIPTLSTDKTIVYKKGKSRLDIISNDYYNTPYNGWLIMLANPEYGGLEFNIPDNAILRVPYPLEEAMSTYVNQVSKHKQLYG
jgi:hypothetical protein